MFVVKIRTALVVYHRRRYAARFINAMRERIVSDTPEEDDDEDGRVQSQNSG